ncbi:MAG: carboxypeptidase regulatory-like domain-containing protein [Actinomyces sp.]|nr:carboxypeptidase regulatory-like domain-containing protein [Actinomyces sp.]MCI1642582.1 carboxypeptidase regulatory-like domain-containing protein [Actinomyces sp.]
MHVPRDRAGRRLLTISVGVALLATTAAGVGPANAQTPPEAAITRVAPATTPDDAPDKLTDAVRSELTADQAADFWVKMADRADLSPATGIADRTERGQYVVDRLKATAQDSQADAIDSLKKAGADYESFWISNRILVKGGDLTLATQLAADPEVKEIHETTTADKPDPFDSKTATASPDTVEWGIAETGAPEAWAMGVTGADITVASVDTGVQYDHPALVNQYRGNNGDGTFTNDYNWFDVSGRCSGAPCDTAGNLSHGTHTMGTMVGSDGGENQIGMAPGAKWIETNGCDTCADADLLRAGEWIAAPTDLSGGNPDVSKRPDIVNNSWGYSAAGTIDDWYADITDAWEASGIFGVWSAGNSGPSCQTTSSPGANTANYSVGNYQSTGQINSRSSRGSGEDGLTKPNIAAPGTSIRSSIVGSDYGLLSGTSMAAPHVAGAVALLWSYAPSLIGDIQGTRDLLNSTARDTDDTSCGGTAANNNVFGEGKLDVMALLDAAPSEGVGTLSGTVADAAGTPIGGATLTATDGDTTRTLTAGADGVYSAQLTEGEFTVTASAYGYVTASQTATIAAEETTTLDFALDAAASHAVSGTVTGGGAPVAGATVSIAPQIDPVVTGEDGTFLFPSVPAGSYTLTASAGTCYGTAEQAVEVDGDTTVALALDPRADAYGYTCAVSEAAYLQGDTPTSLTGDDTSLAVDLPFAFPLYGERYEKAWVSSNGFLNFLGASTSISNGAIPSSAAPNGAIYAFWDDLYVDAQSQVLTGASTVGGRDAFTIEWRNVRKYTPSSDRLSFSATLLEDGTVILGYGAATDTDTARGSSATAGLENADGTVAYQYANMAAFAHEGLTVAFDAPATATVKGRVTDHNTGDAIEGAAITLTAQDGTEVSATTGADGSYSKTLLLGAYDYTIAAGGYQGASGSVTLKKEDGTATRNASLKAGRLEVSTTGIAANLAIGNSATRKVKVTNTGSAPVDVALSAGGEGFTLLGGGAASEVIRHVVGEASVPSPTGAKQAAASNGAARLATAADGSKLATRQPSAIPDAPAVPTGETVLTHSSSQAITPLNSASCNGGPTQILRTFTLSDFDIDEGLDVTAVQFGVETNKQAQDVVVNLYTLDGALAYSNMELIGTATTNLAPQEGTMVNVPVTGSVPSGATLVVEVANQIGGSFYIGSNSAPETAPSYLASDTCGISDPQPTSAVGFEDMHVVMNVVGRTGGGQGVTWLDLQPPTFSLKPGKSVNVAATLTAGVDQPGTYTATIGFGDGTPYAEPTVTASMTVKRPAGWGKITGVVTGDGQPIEGAVVHLDGTSYDVTLRTDADGSYAYWMQKSNAPLTVIVAADGYVPQTRKAQIVNGQTTVYNFALKAL